MSFLLYWFPFSGSLAPMAMLEEIDASYEKILIDITKGEHQSPEYMKIHPLGLVPAIQLENGEHVFESAGICMYLADRYSKFELAPANDDPKRAIYNQWMMFLAGSIYPVYGRIAHPDWYSTDPSQSIGIKNAANLEQRKQWMVVEKTLEDQNWLLGEQFSATDIYMLMLSTWEEDQDKFAEMFPNVTRVALAASKRPAVQRALRWHSA